MFDSSCQKAYLLRYFLVLTDLLYRCAISTGLKGKDLGRKGQTDEDIEIPSALGVVSAVVFLIGIICIQVFDIQSPERNSKYNAAMLAICFMTLLGFADDVLDLPWRFKLVLPPIASLPLLCSYSGGTSIVMPIFSRSLFWNSEHGVLTSVSTILSWFGIVVDPKSAGALVNIGWYYYLYMSLLAVFCTNAINIYAGINGLEVGQAVIIALAVLCTNFYEMSKTGGWLSLQYSSPDSFLFIGDLLLEHRHALSASLMILFLSVALALLKWNWYPAKVFVGDTFCYFAGMTFAVASILGGFSKTILLFFIPQIINFLYSCPQLFGFLPCPRHRLPAMDLRTGLRIPSTYLWKGKEYDNLTLINLVLRVLGPMKEETLTTVLLSFQIITCICGIILRYFVGPLWMYDGK